MRYDVVVAHYGEVTLKRGKRGEFERLLAKNLSRATRLKVRRIQGRLIIELEGGGKLEEVLERVGKVFGVVWYAPAIRVRNGYNGLEERVLEALRELSPKSFKVEARRSDKTFPITSIELARRLGAAVAGRLGIKVDLKSPERTVFVEVTEEGCYVSFERFRGPGGLPVGASGKVLALLSGGIDSPVAAWLMMKRGCVVDLLHLHALRGPEEVLESKVAEIARILSEYGLSVKLFLAPFHGFYERSLEMPPKMELVMFRAYMLKLAERLAEKNGYLGIVTGDSLGQVASQTLENLHAVSKMVRAPIYRPLIGFDKQEVVELAQRIGTYQPSIAEYKDCCSIVARHPETRAKAEVVEELWSKFRLDEAVEESLRSIEAYVFRLGERPEPAPVKAGET